MGAGTAQAPRGRFPSRCGQGGKGGKGSLFSPGLRRKPIFRSARFVGQLAISGITRDSAGSVLPNCTVELFDAESDFKEQYTESDGSGVFSFTVGSPKCYYLVAYKVGSPDVAGTSVNTIRGT